MKTTILATLSAVVTNAA